MNNISSAYLKIENKTLDSRKQNKYIVSKKSQGKRLQKDHSRFKPLNVKHAATLHLVM